MTTAVSGWNAYAPWAKVGYMIGGPRVVREALELGFITPDGAGWLAKWFEKRPGESIAVQPMARETDAPSLVLYTRGGVVELVLSGAGPLDSFGFPQEEEPSPPAPSAVLTIELTLTDGNFFATDNEFVGSGDTPGEALTALGEKLDAQAARDAWEGRKG